jgi:hypothetical protein
MDLPSNPVTFEMLLTGAGIAIAAGAITSLTELLKRVFTRFEGAGLQIAFILSALLYAAAGVVVVSAQQDPNLILLVVLSWIACASGAVGINQVAKKVTAAADGGPSD